MPITHEQARKLIQFSLDGVLQSAEKAMLSAHLEDCLDCKEYANELKELETILLPVMKKQWKARPIPLSVPLLIQGNSSRINPGAILAIRKLAISLVFIALLFSVWDMVASSPFHSGAIPLVVPLVPTPSIQTASSTSTESTAENCEMMVYSVQENDTLASIASQFLVPEEEIIKINELKTDAVRLSMQLLIPICNFTPTGTIDPAPFTTTYTPIAYPTTSTPAGRY